MLVFFGNVVLYAVMSIKPFECSSVKATGMSSDATVECDDEILRQPQPSVPRLLACTPCCYVQHTKCVVISPETFPIALKGRILG